MTIGSFKREGIMPAIVNVKKEEKKKRQVMEKCEGKGENSSDNNDALNLSFLPECIVGILL